MSEWTEIGEADASLDHVLVQEVDGLSPLKYLAALIATLAMLVACGTDPGLATQGLELRTSTWSIVAVNPETAEVGVALATCVAAEVSISRSNTSGEGGQSPHTYGVVGVVGGGPATELARIVPAAGAMIAQARVGPGNSGRLDRAFARLLEGATPAEAVRAAIDGDAMSQQRQYAIAAYDGGVTTFTGSAAPEWSGGVSSTVAAVQGNILVGIQVIERTMAVFQAVIADPGAGLPDALLAGMEAGSAEGGDRRCPREQAALVAFMAVSHRDDVGEAPRLWLATEPQAVGGANPVVLLRQAYDRTLSDDAGSGNRINSAALWALALVASLIVGAGLWTAFRRP